MPDQYPFTRRQVCDMLGITLRTVQYYEYLELIAPRGLGRDKRYSQREVARLKLILRGRRFGMSLEQIRRWLNLYDEKGEKVQLLAWLDIAGDRLAALRDELQETAKKIAELEALRNEVAGAIYGGSVPAPRKASGAQRAGGAGSPGAPAPDRQSMSTM